MASKASILLFVLGMGVTVVGLATISGPDPAPHPEPSELEPFPTGTPHDWRPDSVRSPNNTTESPPFSVTIDAIGDCGDRCRDITVTLQNTQPTLATDIRVAVRVHAGRNTMSRDTVIWTGRESVGTLNAGESVTSTTRLTLTHTDALRVDLANGWVTVLLSVHSADVTISFKHTEQVD